MRHLRTPYDHQNRPTITLATTVRTPCDRLRTPYHHPLSYPPIPPKRSEPRAAAYTAPSGIASPVATRSPEALDGKERIATFNALAPRSIALQDRRTCCAPGAIVALCLRDISRSSAKPFNERAFCPTHIGLRCTWKQMETIARVTHDACGRAVVIQHEVLRHSSHRIAGQRMPWPDETYPARWGGGRQIQPTHIKYLSLKVRGLAEKIAASAGALRINRVRVCLTKARNEEAPVEKHRNKKSSSVTLRLMPELLAEIEDAAGAEAISVSAVIRRLLVSWGAARAMAREGKRVENIQAGSEQSDRRHQGYS